MSTADTLKDQRARDRFIHELDKNFCVSAGAGVGKTMAVVERVVQLALRKPRALPQLVVVTYTRSAAEELRVRSQARMAEELARQPRAQQNPLAEFRRAFFGTIHSFCLKLVREHGRVLGVPANIDLLEESDEPEFWARFCESQALDAVPLPPKLLDAVLRFLSFGDLLALARRLDADAAEKIVRDFLDAPQPDVAFKRALTDPGNRAPENTRANQEMLRAWLREWANGAPFLKLPDVRTGSSSFKAAFTEELAPLARWLGNAAARLATQIAIAYRTFRRDERRLTYADQIAWCRKLLENQRVLDQLRAREWIVILDEAQDTDAAMFSILTEITRRRGAPLGEWPRDRTASAPEPGRFCFVGDEQQAIFASRADLGTYRRYVDAFAAGSGGEVLEFSVTMRCPQRVIDAVNALFFAGDRLRQTHLSFRELHAKPQCDRGATWLLPITPAASKKPIEELFEMECAQVAKFLLEYQPAGLGVSRWSEIAILCPRHRWLARAADVFSRAGVPCRLLAEKKIQLEFPQRSWPAALFYVLVNPWDRFELLGVLREIFAVSDVELADAQAINKPFTFWSSKGLSPRLDAALRTLRGARERVLLYGNSTLSNFVEGALGGTQLAARLAAIGEPASALDGLRYSAFRAECEGVSLREWVSRLCESLYKSAEHPAHTVDEMPMLTSQKAKGLEWPVVIPLGLGRAIRDRSREFPRVERRGEAIAVDLSPLTVDAVAERERETQRREELQRVFYVSLTRAKSLLILPDSAALYGASQASFLALCQWQEADCRLHLQRPSPRARPAAEGEGRVLKRHVAPNARVILKAVERSRAVPHQVFPLEPGHDQRIALPARGAVEIGGMSYAFWWRQTMRRFPWKGSAADRRVFLRGAVESAGAAWRKRAARELDACASFRDEVRRAGREFLVEVPFSHARTEREWMDGIIDLVVVTRSGELWLVDWQTEKRAREERAEIFRARLRNAALPRLEACADMLRKITQRTITQLTIFSTDLGEALRL